MDTVYGLCVSPFREGPVRALYRLKNRPPSKPTALVAADVEVLLDAVPELRGRAGVVARALFPGPYTLIVPNQARRYRWLTGDSPDVIGVRVPAVTGPGHDLLDNVACLAATSANRPGEPDPRRLTQVPDDMRAACGAVLDGGELPGVPSTVIDITGTEPEVVREGLAPADATLERVRAAVW
jgi:L-threonylcarbamoyladenylate synthase